MLCATYPGNAESGQFFNQILMPHGIAGKCLVALFHLNLLMRHAIVQEEGSCRQFGNLSTHSPGTVGAQPGHSRGKI